MNKQEAIGRIENSYTLTIQDNRSDEFLVMLIKADVLDIISQIHEPQKVVVPKFVAEWIEELKKSRSNLAWVWEVYPNEPKIKNWLESNTETFMSAWLDGYEIEQEKLYTAELFNGQPLVEANNVLYFSSDLTASNALVSKDKLEAAGFGWVFDCDGVKVVEVKE